MQNRLTGLGLVQLDRTDHPLVHYPLTLGKQPKSIPGIGALLTTLHLDGSFFEERTYDYFGEGSQHLSQLNHLG